MLAFSALIALGMAAPLAEGAKKSKTLKGKVRVRHSDDFRHASAANDRYLSVGKRNFRLVGAEAAKLKANAQVEVTGHGTGSSFDVDRTTSVTASRRSRKKAKLSALTNKTVVVLLAAPASGPGLPFGTTAVRDTLLTGPGSVRALYSDSTSGQLNLSGNVYGNFTIPGSMPTDTAGCRATWPIWLASAKAQAASRGINVDNYSYYVLATPKLPQCNYSGSSNIGVSGAHINGYNDVRTFAHELGHNFGLQHASSLTCSQGVSPATYSSSCNKQEYGDPFDLMGNTTESGAAIGPTRQPNAYHKAQLRDLGSPVSLAGVVASTQYRLYASEAGMSPPTALAIPRSGAPADSNYLFLDFRKPSGAFDNFSIHDPVTKGVSLRVGNTDVASSLLDATPDGNFLDSSLKPGSSYSDSTGFSVRTDSIDPDGNFALVTVNLDQSAPTAPTNLTAQTVGATTVRLNWSTSTDNIGVTGYSIFRDGAYLGASTYSFYGDMTPPPGTHTYTVKARDAAGNFSAASNVATATVLDLSVKPIVTITSPLPEASMYGNGRVVAFATDDGPVRRMLVYVDGRRRSSRHGSTIDKLLQIAKRSMASGEHTVKVTAEDYHRNVGEAETTIFKM